jgi:thiol-disulfide isomerase/thioredoxin
MFRVIEAPTQGYLSPTLAAAVAEANKESLQPVAYFYADWCPPCQALRKSFTDPLIVAALEGTYIVQFSADVWKQSARSNKFFFNAIPVLFTLDEQGLPVDRIDGSAWSENTPKNMAVALRRFFHQPSGTMASLWRLFSESSPSLVWEGKNLQQWIAEMNRLAEVHHRVTFSRERDFDLRDKQLKELEAARKAFGEMFGDRAPATIPALIDNLKSGSDSVRSWTVHVLNTIGPLARQAVPALTRALDGYTNKPNSLHVFASMGIANALGFIGTAAGVPALARAIQKKNDSVATCAVSALARAGTPEGIATLIKALADQNIDVPVRCDIAKAAVAALATIKAHSPQEAKAAPRVIAAEPQPPHDPIAHETQAEATSQVRFICPKCDKRLKAPETARGKKVKCSKCGHPLKVPAAQDTVQPPAPIPPKAHPAIGSRYNRRTSPAKWTAVLSDLADQDSQGELQPQLWLLCQKPSMAVTLLTRRPEAAAALVDGVPELVEFLDEQAAAVFPVKSGRNVLALLRALFAGDYGSDKPVVLGGAAACAPSEDVKQILKMFGRAEALSMGSIAQW